LDCLIKIKTKTKTEKMIPPLTTSLEPKMFQKKKGQAISRLNQDNYRNSFIMNFGLKSEVGLLNSQSAILEVNPREGPYFSISSAIEAAPPHSTILIH
jgi:hypothetical protein